MTDHPFAHHISDLQQKLTTIYAEFCAGVDNYALLDYPDHTNVGDSAIYIGEMKLFDQLIGKKPKFVSSIKNYVQDIERFDPVDIIFLHGGGNFGDIWPRYQRQREAVITKYRDRKIVQLPQTLHFGDAKNLERTARVIAKHPDFTLMVRDKVSLEIAQKAFDCRIILSPDSAMAIGPIDRPVAPDVPLLGLLRNDREATGRRDTAAQMQVEDWIKEAEFRAPTDRVLNRAFRFFGGRRKRLMPHFITKYEEWATIRVARGAAQLSRGETVVTDRLHGHIISTLLGIRHGVLDNSYGKLSSYTDCWGLPAGIKTYQDLAAFDPDALT